MKPLIAPSILSADFANLQKDIDMVNNSEADWFHLDVMDGVFVPNISFGVPVVQAIRKHAKKTLDVHLMIIEPQKYISVFQEAGADNITVHFETCPNLEMVIRQIRDVNCKAGVAISPDTKVEVLEPFLGEIDLVCMMSVYPGFGGQEYIVSTDEKISELRAMIDKKGLETLIEVDGGVKLDNAGRLVELGADVLVAGSTVFSSGNPTQTIADLKTISV